MSKMPAFCRSFCNVVLKVIARFLVPESVVICLEIGCGKADFLDAQSGAGTNPVLGREAKRGEQYERNNCGKPFHEQGKLQYDYRS